MREHCIAIQNSASMTSKSASQAPRPSTKGIVLDCTGILELIMMVDGSADGKDKLVHQFLSHVTVRTKKYQHNYRTACCSRKACRIHSGVHVIEGFQAISTFKRCSCEVCTGHNSISGCGVLKTSELSSVTEPDTASIMEQNDPVVYLASPSVVTKELHRAKTVPPAATRITKTTTQTDLPIFKGTLSAESHIVQKPNCFPPCAVLTVSFFRYA